MMHSESSRPEVPFGLELLARGVGYQNWIAHTVAPYLGNRILEVGSGIANLSQQWQDELAPLPCEKTVPIVRGVDDFLYEKLRISLGQSLLCVWEKS